jgi:hypothetical protein
LRNKFTLTFLKFLLKENIIEGYNFLTKTELDIINDPYLKLGKKGSSYYTPVEIRLKHNLFTKMIIYSTPGNYEFFSKTRLSVLTYRAAGAGALVICSSSKYGGLCTSKELLAIGEGGLVLCIAKISGATSH